MKNRSYVFTICNVYNSHWFDFIKSKLEESNIRFSAKVMQLNSLDSNKPLMFDECPKGILDMVDYVHFNSNRSYNSINGFEYYVAKTVYLTVDISNFSDERIKGLDKFMYYFIQNKLNGCTEDDSSKLKNRDTYIKDENKKEDNKNLLNNSNLFN